MTLAMADSITAANLPPGYDAYCGYVDGEWPDYPAIVTRFPGAHTWSVTVLGSGADECDCETGDLTPAEAVSWARSRIGSGVQRPGIYANASTMATGVLPALSAAGVPTSSVRLRSAHYGAGEHICGPATCKLVPVSMDGTQWTDTAAGAGGTQIDASLLAADFFATPAPAITVPAGLGNSVSATATCHWDPVPNATHYDFQMTDAWKTSQVGRVNVLAPAVTVEVALPAAGLGPDGFATYWWHVAAYDAAGDDSGWSAWFELQV
jgi:hypothetical protein